MEKYYALTNIPKDYLIKECGIDKDALQKTFSKEAKKYRSFQKNLFGGYILEDDFTDDLCIWGDDKRIKTITLSYSEFLTKLQRLLNIQNININDSDELSKAFNKRLKKLDTITSYKQLEASFPALASIYQKGIDYYYKKEAFKSYADTMPMDKKLNNMTFEYDNYYDNCGLSLDFEEFLENQKRILSNMVLKRGDLFSYIIHRPFHKSLYDPDKFTYAVLNKIFSSKKTNNPLFEDVYLNIINGFLKKESHKDITIQDEFDNTVDLSKMLLKAKRYLKDLDDPLEVYWEISSPSKDDKESKSGSHRIGTKYFEEKSKSFKERERKQAFYNSTDFLEMAIGKLRYNGYVAFIYPNGKVVTDTLPSDRSINLARENAIYVFDANDFLELSKEDKASLKKNPKVDILNHSKTWEDRVSRIINAPLENGEEEALKLIKKLK